MIFYKRITICNLFAYNDIQRINFVKQNNKPIYLLFGKNGFGKTSFIRSIKLLFAGSGLLNTEEKVPNVVLNFTNDRARGVFTPKTFLLGQNSDNGWQGAFNHSAVKNNQNNFYVELELEEEGQSVIIKREWSLFPRLNRKINIQNRRRNFIQQSGTRAN